MSSPGNEQGQSALGALTALRRFVRPRVVAERCELCSVVLPADHQHLLEPSSRLLACSCEACAILFSGQRMAKYKRVPRRLRFLQDFQMTDGQWESLMLPIGMAFFFYSTPEAKVMALYPSPAGPTESLLGLDTWDEIVRDNALLKELEPDVEALLVNRVGTAREYYLAPIDECFKLVGLIRANWHGLSGGSEAWDAIGKFFASLKERSGQG